MEISRRRSHHRGEAHRRADARWRASLSHCYDILSTIGNKRKRISRMEILKRTTQHLQMLEWTIRDLLKVKEDRAVRNSCPLPVLDVQHYREQFRISETFTFGQNFDVLTNPYLTELYGSVVEREMDLASASAGTCPDKESCLMHTPTTTADPPPGAVDPRKGRRPSRGSGRSARRLLLEEESEWTVPSGLSPLSVETRPNTGSETEAFLLEQDPESFYETPLPKLDQEEEEEDCPLPDLASPVASAHIVWLNKSPPTGADEDQMVPDDVQANLSPGFSLSNYLKWCDNDSEENQVVPASPWNNILDG